MRSIKGGCIRQKITSQGPVVLYWQLQSAARVQQQAEPQHPALAAAGTGMLQRLARSTVQGSTTVVVSARSFVEPELSGVSE